MNGIYKQIRLASLCHLSDNQIQKPLKKSHLCGRRKNATGGHAVASNTGEGGTEEGRVGGTEGGRKEGRKEVQEGRS